MFRVVHVDQAAYDRRIRVGRTLADARALVPELAYFDDDPAADRRQLEALAVWAGCLSPIVHIEGQDTLLVDVTGCERLFNGEGNLLRRAMDGVAAQALAVRGAVADSAGAAWALAHAHPEPGVVSPPGQVAADLVPLPVWSLRIERDVVASLASVGIETVASLLHLPRASLSLRFGEAVLDRLDQALGDLVEVLTPYRPAPVLAERCSFGAATARMDVLREAVGQSLERFCRRLQRRGAGVRQLFGTFYCPDVPCDGGTQTRRVTVPVDLSQPTRLASHLQSLLSVVLETLSLPAPADSLMLWTRSVESLDGWQDELFETGTRDAQQLGDFVDRLAMRLGPDRVVRPQPVSDHQPERAFRYVPLVGKTADGSPSRRGHVKAKNGATETAFGELADVVPPGPRPLRLLPRPVRIDAMAVVPEGPPVSFRWEGRGCTVADCAGPERIETGWWRGPHLRRDYYRVLTEEGRRCWLFCQRDTGRWFLHGWFD